MTESQVPNGIQLVLVIDDKRVGGNYMPLPDSYSQAEQSLRELFVVTRDLLARYYEDKALKVADEQFRRAETLNEEVARLNALLAEKTP